MKDRNNIKTEHQHTNKSNIHTRQSWLINRKLKKWKTESADVVTVHLGHSLKLFFLPSFLRFVLSIPVGLTLQQRYLYSLNLEAGHCQLPEFKDFPLNISLSCLIRRLPDYCSAHGERAVEKMGFSSSLAYNMNFNAWLTTYSLQPLSGHTAWNTWTSRLPFINISYHFYFLSCERRQNFKYSVSQAEAKWSFPIGGTLSAGS